MSLCVCVCLAQSGLERSFLTLDHFNLDSLKTYQDDFRMTQSTWRALLSKHSESNKNASYRRSLKYFVLFLYVYLMIKHKNSIV